MMRLSSSPDISSSPDRFRDLMARWPTGVAVVTADDDGKPAGCTVTAVVSVSASPPLLLVSLAAHSRTREAVQRAGRFGLCVLPVSARRLAAAFATGDPAGRFAGVPFDWVYGVPVLRAAATAAVCDVHDGLAVADHVLLTGEPVWQHQRAQDPLVWFHRGPRRLCSAEPP